MALTPTLNEIVFSILNTVRSRTNISEPISIEQVKFHIKNVRAQLIKQDSNKGYSADTYIIQDLGCVETTVVPKGECCDVSTECTILRTKEPIPSPIELHHEQLLTRIGPIDKTQPNFDRIQYERVPFEGYNRFTNGFIKSFTMNNNGYIYFLTPKTKQKMMKYVNIQGVFEDPQSVAAFTSCDGDPCYSDDAAYPVKAWMVPVIIEMVVKIFVGPQAKAMSDPTNNAKFDLENPLSNQ